MSKHTFHCPKCEAIDTTPLPEFSKYFCMKCNHTYVCPECANCMERAQVPHEENFRKSVYDRRPTDGES